MGQSLDNIVTVTGPAKAPVQIWQTDGRLLEPE